MTGIWMDERPVRRPRLSGRARRILRELAWTQGIYAVGYGIGSHRPVVVIVGFVAAVGLRRLLD